MRSDRELICRYREGDEEAFREFYERHRRALFVYLLSLVKSRETAEELLQDTFYSFLRSLGRLNGSAGLRPYLVRAARNRAIDHLRRLRRDAEAIEWRAEDAIFKARGRESVGLGESSDWEAMDLLLRRLPDEQRETIVLKVLLGMTFREIAELDGSPEASVVSRYRYGMEKLRSWLKKEHCDDRTGSALSRA